MHKAILASLILLPGIALAQSSDYIRYYPPSGQQYQVGTFGAGINFYPHIGVGYFVDATGGSDSADGKSSGTAWKTLSKVNGFTFNPNDLIYLKRGETWRETLTVPANSLTFGAYGGGPTPVISAVPVMSGVAEETGGIFVSGLEDETSLFTTDFTNKSAAGGNTITVSTDRARTGAKAAKVTFAGASMEAYTYKTLASQTELWVRGWFYVSSAWTQSDAAHSTNLIQIFDSVDGLAVLMGLSSQGVADSTPWLWLGKAANGPAWTVQQPVIVSPEVWHSFEFHWLAAAGTGGVEFFFDGVSVWSDFAITNTNYVATSLVVGSFSSTSIPSAGSVVYFDDVKVSATGPIGDSVTRRANAIDLNGKDNISISGLDLANFGTTAIDTTGSTGTALSDVRSIHPSPWTAPSDSAPATTIVPIRAIDFAITGSWIMQSGALLVMDAASHVKKSTDGGANWTTLKTFPDAGLTGNAVMEDSRGYLHAFPSGGASTSGVWTSTDGGANWTRTLNTSALAQPGGMWGVDEDADGRLFAGYYHSDVAAADAVIYRSTDGLNWSSVYDNGTDRHVHSIAVDDATGYVYAILGDNGTWNSPITLRSTDHGDNWSRILNTIPQMTGVYAGSGYRLFGTDSPGSRAAIYRTTDDAAYTEVLSVPRTLDCLWIRADAATGYVYAGFGGSTATSGSAGIWRSKDAGLTWDQVLALPITAAADGTSAASNISGRRLIASTVSGGTAVGGAVYSLP